MRKKFDNKLGDLRVMGEQLPATVALGILPDVLLMLTPAINGLQYVEKLSEGDGLTLQDMVEMMPSINGTAKAMADGRLLKLAPVLLSTTTIFAPDMSGKPGVLAKWELSDPRNIDVVLDDVGQLLTICWWSVNATFASFLGVLARRAKPPQAPSASPDSSPSTTP